MTWTIEELVTVETKGHTSMKFESKYKSFIEKNSHLQDGGQFVQALLC